MWIQVVLSLPTLGSNDDDEQQQHQLVEVDVMLSAHANARLMYEDKKMARTKELKTLKVRLGCGLIMLGAPPHRIYHLTGSRFPLTLGGCEGGGYGDRE